MWWYVINKYCSFGFTGGNVTLRIALGLSYPYICVHYEPLSCAYCAHCAKFTPHASTAMSTSPTGMFITPPTPTHVTC